MQLTEHFHLYEVERSYIAKRLGINNKLPKEYIDNAVAVAHNILEPARVYFNRPINPSSWYRSSELNTAVKSRPSSQHTKGEAVDFEIAGVDNLKLAQWVEENCEFDQLVLEFYKGEPSSGWVHASYCIDRPLRSEVLWTPDGKKFYEGLPE